jgi:hypothetical protein
MMPLLFVVDSEFTCRFKDKYQGTTKTFQEVRVVARLDKGVADLQIDWDDCVDTLLAATREKATSLIIAVAHKGVLRRRLSGLDEHKAEVRIPAVERELAEKLGADAPPIYVSGFHHVAESGISRLLSDPEDLKLPETFGRIRSLVEEGGGPLGHLSLLKHNLMRPFASVRLRLQIDAERDDRNLDPLVVKSVSGSISIGQAELEKLVTKYEATDPFNIAIAKARDVLAEDVTTITSDAVAFSRWVDKLNAALDCVRVEAR